MYKILVARPSVHISYGIGETQREQRSDHLNTGDSDGDSSDRFVPFLVQVGDDTGAASVGDLDGALVSDGAAEGAGGAAARVGQGDADAVVLGTVLTATAELLLDVVDNGISSFVHRSAGPLVEECVDGVDEALFDRVPVGEQ